jgi:hypothetical protein
VTAPFQGVYVHELDPIDAEITTEKGVEPRLRSPWAFGRGVGKFIQPVSFLPGVVSENSRVCASITEVDANRNPFMGAAFMQVYNVVPRKELIVVPVHIFWDRALPFRLSFLIEGI